MSVQSSSSESSSDNDASPEDVSAQTENDVEVGSDGDLIQLARNGDSNAFDSLVRRHADRLLRMVRNLVANQEDAEDVTQEALAAAFFKLDSFAGRSSFFTWLYRIALNKAISRRRLRRIETTHQGRTLDDAPPPTDDSSRVENKLEQEEELIRLRAAIAQLEPDRRSALVLRDVDGRDYGEIAEILNIPVGTVRSRLHRARCDLRAILERGDAIMGGGTSV